MNDGDEVAAGSNPLVQDAPIDTDGDGLTDAREAEIGTAPKNKDTDGDGLEDWAEDTGGTNPLKGDGDGIGDRQELGAGTDPNDSDPTTMARPTGPIATRSMRASRPTLMAMGKATTPTPRRQRRHAGRERCVPDEHVLNNLRAAGTITVAERTRLQNAVARK